MAELFGKLTKKMDTETVGNSGFKKRNFIVVTEEQYPQEIQLQMVQGNVSLLDNFQLDSMVKITFDIKGKPWTKDGKTSYFVTLQAWKIETHAS